MGTGTGDFSTCRQGTGDPSATGAAHSQCASARDTPARAFWDTDPKHDHVSQSYHATTSPPPFPALRPAKPLKGKAKMLGTHILPSPDPEPPSPLITCEKESMSGNP